MPFEQTTNRDARPKPAPLDSVYPKYLHHPSGKAIRVNNAAEEAKLDKRVWGPKPHPQFTGEPAMPGDNCKNCGNMRAQFDHAFSRVTAENGELSQQIANLTERKAELEEEVSKLMEANQAWAQAEQRRMEEETLILPVAPSFTDYPPEDPAAKMMASAPQVEAPKPAKPAKK
jgi:hypothetical protein